MKKYKGMVTACIASMVKSKYQGTGREESERLYMHYQNECVRSKGTNDDKRLLANGGIGYDEFYGLGVSTHVPLNENSVPVLVDGSQSGSSVGISQITDSTSSTIKMLTYGLIFFGLAGIGYLVYKKLF